MTTKQKTLKDIYSGTIYADGEVLKNAPRNLEGELEFFTLGRYVSDKELEKEYETRGLIPADPFSLARWDEAHQKNPHEYLATHWKDAEGKWCYATFYRWHDDRFVIVDRLGRDWDGVWWFAGLRKSGSLTLRTSDLASLSPLVERVEKVEHELERIKNILKSI